MYPLTGAIDSLVGEGVSQDDIFREDVTDGFNAGFLAFGFEEVAILLREAIQQALAAGLSIIREQFYAVDAGDGQHSIFFVLKLRVLL